MVAALVFSCVSARAQPAVAPQDTVAKLIVATSPGCATYRAYFTEMSARLLLQARQLDGPITFADAEEAVRINESQLPSKRSA